MTSPTLEAHLPWVHRTDDGSVGTVENANGQVVVQAQELPGSNSTVERVAQRQETAAFVVQAVNSDGPMREALEAMLATHDWVVEAGGTKGPLPNDVIEKFAALQLSAVDMARAALTLSSTKGT